MSSYRQPRRLAAQLLVITLLLLLFFALLLGASAATAVDPSVVWLPLDLAGLVGSLGLGLLLAAYARGTAALDDDAARQALRIATAAWAILSFGAFAVVGLGITLAAVEDDISVALLAAGAAASVLLASITASNVHSHFTALSSRST